MRLRYIRDHVLQRIAVILSESRRDDNIVKIEITKFLRV